MEIDRYQQILAQIRSTILDRSETSAKASKARRSDRTPHSQPGTGRSSVESVRAQTQSSISVLNLDEAAGISAARKAFVQAILMEEFGPQVASDPKFGVVIDKIESTMSSDAEVCQKMDSLLRRTFVPRQDAQ